MNIDVRRPVLMPDSKAGLRSVSIVGAGLMGRSIAAVNLAREIPVTIADVDRNVVDATISWLHEQAQPGRPTNAPHFLSARPARELIRPAESAATSANADLIIEAVAERLEVKRQVFSELAPHLSPKTIVASNTSCIPLSRMADCLPHPERFCGLHFCHPVSERALVEVVRGRATSDETLAKVVEYVQYLGKRPVVVRDRPGFVVNRLLLPYLNEALELVLEGADVDAVEQAAVAFGMPAGPFRQLDEFGIDVVLRTGMVFHLAFPDRVAASPLLIAMYKNGRLGRKGGGGFFASDEDSPHEALAPEAAELIQQLCRSDTSFTHEQITRRLFLPMLIEATRILEEEVVAAPADVDVALEEGLAFRPPAGGLLKWADKVGVGMLLELIKEFEALGSRFQPTELLLELARGGSRFFL